MIDYKFMTDIISKICDYAVQNKMQPDVTLKTVAENILSLLELSTFNNWEPEKGDGESAPCGAD